MSKLLIDLLVRRKLDVFDTRDMKKMYVLWY